MSGPSLQSLIVLLPLMDAEQCTALLAQQRAALEAGWLELPRLRSACFAVVPASRREPASLLFECTFTGELSALASALSARLGAQLEPLFAQCEGGRRVASASALYELLGRNARRAARAGQVRPSASEALASAWRRLRARLTLSVRAPRAEPRAADYEQRRSAACLQQGAPGVPLLHLSHVLPEAQRRAKRGLRDLELGHVGVQGAARFWLSGDRLLLLAYPDEPAPVWAERTSRSALAALSALWLDTREFAAAPARSEPRARYLWRFLLDERVPVGAWFKAIV